MINWLLKFFGLAPTVTAAERKLLVGKIRESPGTESSIMVEAQAAIDRHDVREKAIADHRAKVNDETAKCRKQRQERQDEIQKGTMSMEQTRRKSTTRQHRRSNPFDLSDMARKEAQRRREA